MEKRFEISDFYLVSKAASSYQQSIRARKEEMERELGVGINVGVGLLEEDSYGIFVRVQDNSGYALESIGKISEKLSIDPITLTRKYPYDGRNFTVRIEDVLDNDGMRVW